MKNQASKPTVKFNFNKPEHSLDKLLAEVELVLPEPLAGLKLVGISVWQTEKHGPSVTLPARTFGMGDERRFFDFLRGCDGVAAVKQFKAEIVNEYKQWAQTQPQKAVA